jgi:hypothetical protein
LVEIESTVADCADEAVEGLAVGVDQSQINSHTYSVVDDIAIVTGCTGASVHIEGEAGGAGKVALAIIKIIATDAAGAG